MPIDDIDYAKLAKLSVAGGNIRNIALNAAFLAADDGAAIAMSHLLQAAHGEAAKRDRADFGRGNTGMGMKQVLVDIENLVLKGFRYEDRHAIAAALQDELVRLLATPETAARLASLGHVPRLNIGSLNVEANQKPSQVGTETGRAIGKGLLK